MDELNQGFHNDLSKTFDTDDLNDWLTKHVCVKLTAPIYLQPGTACPFCGEVIKEKM